jgi:hypothetical protein
MASDQQLTPMMQQYRRVNPRRGLFSAMRFATLRGWVLAVAVCLPVPGYGEMLRYHTLVVDGQDKILPWYAPAGNAFDNYLDKCWAWAVAAPLDTHGLPIPYLYCAWRPGNPPTIDPGWENDVGEKIPNRVESARVNPVRQTETRSATGSRPAAVLDESFLCFMVIQP